MHPYSLSRRDKGEEGMGGWVSSFSWSPFPFYFPYFNHFVTILRVSKRPSPGFKEAFRPGLWELGPGAASGGRLLWWGLHGGLQRLAQRPGAHVHPRGEVHHWCLCSGCGREHCPLRMDNM